MDKVKLEKEIYDIAKPIAESCECELVDVEFLKENREWYLRIYIDKPEGIYIDDCTRISKKLSDKLDEIDPIEYSYYLEVSSPGLDRPLKKESDFERNKGKKIKVKFIKPVDGKKSIQGILMGIEGNNVVLEVDGNLFKIDRNTASSIKLNDF